MITENSEISRLAERAFLAALPGRWIASQPKEGDDYGIDVSLQIPDGAHPSGRLAHVQLKGTRAAGADSSLIRVKESTLNHLRSMADAAVILRTQVDDGRSWLVHIHDPRTSAPPDDSGWVRIACTDQDLVTREMITRRIATLSYRKRWQSTPKADFKILVHGDGAALTLHSTLSEGLPPGLTFVSAVGDDASVQAECIPSSTGFVLRDFATTIERNCDPARSALDALLSVGAFLALCGGWSLATAIIAKSADLIDDETIDRCLTQVEQTHYVGVLIDHGSDAELAALGERGTRAGQAWAARWFTMFLVNGRLRAVTERTLDDVFAAWPEFKDTPAVRLMKAQLLARFGHHDACRTTLQSITLDDLDDPAVLYEFAVVAERVDLRDSSRRAWHEAQIRGYDAMSCQLEIARSLLIEGRAVEAIRRVPRKGQLKDARSSALFHAFNLIRRVLGHMLAKDAGVLQTILSDLGNTAHTMALATQPDAPGSPEGKQLLATVFSLILALRDEESIEAWTAALTGALLLRAPAPLIDAIIDLASARHGGEPLRRAAVVFKGDQRAVVLEKWHRRVDENKGRNLFRRREDFVRIRPAAARPEKGKNRNAGKNSKK